jgi:hypothetical protein
LLRLLGYVLAKAIHLLSEIIFSYAITRAGG